MDETRQPGVQLSQIFLKKARFDHRDDVLSLPADQKVAAQQVEIGINVFGTPDDKAAAVVVRVASQEDPSALYSFEVEVVGLVERIPGEENLSPREYGAKMGAAALYPFVREAVANLTLRGRFGPVWLHPFNFRAVESVPLTKSDRDQLPARARGRAAKRRQDRPKKKT